MRPNPVLILCAALWLAAPAQAQYKVVAPDGRVTYTDRPPADASLNVTPLRQERSPEAPDPAASLPLELRRLSERFPVTLFSGTDCTPCDRARGYLQQRGVPYTEKLVISQVDIEALERTVAGRTLPSLTVGGQALRGYSAEDWASYLDAAGYPRQSLLPASWEPPRPQPLVARTAPRAEPKPAEKPPEPTLPPPPQPTTTIRF